jgi:nucleotide-binding universal stress UspA family protein
MKTINKIMVAVDFSEYSLAAASYAARLAQEVDAGLLFTHVYNKRNVEMLNMVAARVPEFSVKGYVDEQVDEKKNELQHLVDTLNCGRLAVEINVLMGVPHDALLQEIEEKKPDLLVMGAKGRSNVMDIILGSCAQRMFKESPIPLLSIRGN